MVARQVLLDKQMTAFLRLRSREPWMYLPVPPYRTTARSVRRVARLGLTRTFDRQAAALCNCATPLH
jgi:hypothetical protein